MKREPSSVTVSPSTVEVWPTNVRRHSAFSMLHCGVAKREREREGERGREREGEREGGRCEV